MTPTENDPVVRQMRWWFPLRGTPRLLQCGEEIRHGRFN